MSLPLAETGYVTTDASERSVQPRALSWLRHGLLRWLGGLLILLGGSSRATAQTTLDDGVSREYLIKAAFLYNFARYVQWPNEATDPKTPFVIGLLQPEPFGPAIEQVRATKSLEGRPIVIARFASMAEYRPCHILFVAAAVSPTEKAAALRETRGKPVLVVGEEPGFATRGGVINFFAEDNRIRFEINVEAAKQQRLQISSKLMTLGKVVGP